MPCPGVPISPLPDSASLQRSVPAVEWARLQASAGIWASVRLTLPPTEHGLSFLDAEYAALARFRLRLPLQPSGGACRRREPSGRPLRPQDWFDPEGDHAHSCAHNSGARTRRHRYLRDQICRQLRWLGFWALTEQSDSRLCHRPDVRAQGFSLPLTHL